MGRRKRSVGPSRRCGSALCLVISRGAGRKLGGGQCALPMASSSGVHALPSTLPGDKLHQSSSLGSSGGLGYYIIPK
uniref:Uncharacterized protein n=1 Tax=Oryza punctata TaxID=4537 RepID=A0A0E0LAE9_ORYPU